MVPVHADDHHLLGIQWQNETLRGHSPPIPLYGAPANQSCEKSQGVALDTEKWEWQ